MSEKKQSVEEVIDAVMFSFRVYDFSVSRNFETKNKKILIRFFMLFDAFYAATWAARFQSCFCASHSLKIFFWRH